MAPNPPGGYIQIWFTSFQTEPSDSCSSDAVSIYSGTTVTPLTVPVRRVSPPRFHVFKPVWHQYRLRLHDSHVQKQLVKLCEGATNVDTAIWQYHDPNGVFYDIDQVFNFTSTVTVVFTSDTSNTFNGFNLAYDFSTCV